MQIALRQAMLALENGFLSTIILLSILFLILLYPRHQIQVHSDKYDFAIFDSTIIFVANNDTTLSYIHWLVLVVASDVDLSFTECIEGDKDVVIETRGEVNVICITSMGQIGLFVKLSVPLSFRGCTVDLIESAVGFAEHLDTRVSLPRRQEKLIHDLFVVCIVVVKGCEIE